MKKQREGITLIALVITIIILLILAGVAISLTIGEHGILNMAKLSKEESKKAEVKQEIEFAILEIQAECSTNDKEFTMDLLQTELSKKLIEMTAEKDEKGQIIGEYKGYDYTITTEYKVIVEKAKGKPDVTYTLSDETIGINELTITLTATPIEGTITKITKPNDDYEENVTQVQYKVTKNGTYKFVVEASNGTKTTKIIKITNLKPTAPVIDSTAIYPILTAYGIERPKVKIIYEENETLEHYYSEDGGTTWKKYIGEFTASGSTILAKSVVKEHEECYTQVQLDIVSSDDALGIEAYDGDETTYDQPKAGKIKKIRISSEMQNKNIELTAQIGSYDNKYPSYIMFYDQDGNKISEIGECRRTFTKELILIPDGTVEIQFKRHGDGSIPIYEICEGYPTISETVGYPQIGKDGIDPYFSNVIIEYNEMSVQKLYKIDEGEWQDYHNSIKLEVGQTVYAKGINEKGEQSTIKKYTALMPDNAVGTYAYDGDKESGINHPKEKYIYVSEEMINKDIKITSKTYSGNTGMTLYFYNKENVEMSKMGLKSGEDVIVTIPSDTYKIKISSSGSNSWPAWLYEIIVVSEQE